MSHSGVPSPPNPSSQSSAPSDRAHTDPFKFIYSPKNVQTCAREQARVYLRTRAREIVALKIRRLHANRDDGVLRNLAKDARPGTSRGFPAANFSSYFTPPFSPYGRVFLSVPTRCALTRKALKRARTDELA